MTFQLNEKDMTHICLLLHDDLLCCKKLLEDDPLDDEAAASMLRSKRVLLKVSTGVLLQVYEPNTMESKRRLN